MDTTQQKVLIDNITDNLVLLKDGGAVLLLRVGAVNFGLLSEREQLALVDAFAQMLNSLSFAIQIFIQSQRLDVSQYLKLLDQAQTMQNNPLLSQMIAHYKQFVSSTIKENEVLDKSFYIVVPVSYLELGILPQSLDEKVKKIKTIILPRRDQILRQLSRIGLKATPLNSLQLIKLFYNLFNFSENSAALESFEPVSLQTPQPVQQVTRPVNQPSQPPINQQVTPAPTAQPVINIPKPRNHPFAVEELMDTI